MTSEQFKNLLAFLFLMGCDNDLASKSPDYIIEKAKRYLTIEAITLDVQYGWGLHPILRESFDLYCKYWSSHIINLDK